MTLRAAAVDVGTNSVRMLVADLDGGALREVERDLIITRLGEGVDRERALGDEPVRRTVEAIGAFWNRCVAAGAQQVRVAATSAVRDAENRDRFLSAVRERIGAGPDVLSGDEEARLGFAGATADLDPEAGPYLVLDIGGGSTEFVRGDAEARAWISMDVGSVRLTERLVSGDPPAPGELAAVADATRGVLPAVRDAVAPEGARRLVGLAGTITTAAALALGLKRYDRGAIHHAMLSRAQVGEVRERLAGMRSAQRRALPVMPPGREDVIVAGLVILETVMDGLGYGDVLVSESDILDGLVRSLA